jgi:hypothetical protein
VSKQQSPDPGHPLFGKRTPEAPPSEWETETEEDRVHGWRVSQLCDGGFSYNQANALAQAKIDYHRALDMLRHGASHEMIVGILT